MPISRITGASIEDGSITLADLGITTIDAGTGNTLTLQANSRTGIVIDTSGNTAIANTVTFSSTGARIRGDFSNATVANRTAFQSSTTNGNTSLPIIPNGTGNVSNITSYNNSDPTNSAAFIVGVRNSGTEAGLNSTITGSGTYLPITFLTGGSERLRIDTSGNVGIGTNNPSVKLNVYDSSADTVAYFDSANVNGPHFRFLNSGVSKSFIGQAPGFLTSGTSADDLGIRATGSLVFGTNGNNIRMAISSAGNVGIGTTSPSQKLHVAAGTILSSNTAGTIATVSIAGNGSTVGTSDFALQQGTSSEAYVYNRANSFLVIGTNNTERMRIDSSGLVGIGTTNTQEQLTVQNSIQMTNNASNLSGLYFGTNSNPALRYSYIQSDGRSTGYINFNTNAAERMRITSGGDVGIGTSSPGNKLHVQSGSSGAASFDSRYRVIAESNGETYFAAYSSTFCGYRHINGSGNQLAAMDYFVSADRLNITSVGAFSVGTSNTERMRIDASGNVGIGTSSPSGKLDVRGSSMLLINSTNPTIWASVDSGLTTHSMYMQVNTTSNDTRIGAYTNHPLQFVTNNTERMRIDTSGNIGANVVPWTGISNAFNYVTGVQRYIANGSMNAGTWTNTSLTLTSNDGFVYAELVAIGNENGRNNGYKVYTILWNSFDGWQVSLKYSSQHGNNYGMVDVRMSGSTVQVKAENNISGGPYRLFLTYYIY